MAKTLKADAATYDDVMARLQAREPVALPTETVYGLAALATDDEAVQHVYEIKGRPQSKPLSVVVSSASAATDIAEVPDTARKLMDEFWPGPLTLVLPLKANGKISPHVLAGGQTVGMRCPDIPWMAYFKEKGFHTPLVLPSANTSGKPAPTNARDVNTDIGDKISVIVDGGDCKTGVESTIVAFENGKTKILRKGAIPPEAFAPYILDWET